MSPAPVSRYLRAGALALLLLVLGWRTLLPLAVEAPAGARVALEAHLPGWRLAAVTTRPALRWPGNEADAFVARVELEDRAGEWGGVRFFRLEADGNAYRVAREARAVEWVVRW